MQNDLKRDFGALLGIVVFYIILQKLGITCPIKFITGISCPGCGMTRAWIALVSGNLSKAVMYHPLFWLPVPVAVSYFQWRKGKNRRVYQTVLIVAVILFVAVYIVRMFAPDDSVVVFCPKKGMIGKLILLLCSG